MQGCDNQGRHLEERGRYENGDDIARLEDGLLGENLEPVLVLVFDPSHQPVEYGDITVYGDVYVFEALPGCDVTEVPHLGEQEVLRAAEVFPGVTRFVADVDSDFATETRGGFTTRKKALSSTLIINQ